MAALNKRVLRKVDWRLMPTITIIFLLKYVSPAKSNQASLIDIQLLDRII